MRALTLVAAHNEANQTRIAEMGGVEAFLLALEDEQASSKVKAAAANGLCALARHAANKTAIAGAGGIEALLRLTETARSREARKSAAAALRNLSSNNLGNKMALATPRAAEALVALVTAAVADVDNDVAEEAVATVANAARTADDANRLCFAGAMRPLVTIVSSNGFESRCRAHAAGALAVLACAGANKTRLSAEGGIEPLARLVASGPASCKYEATCALRNLTAAKLGDDLSHQVAVDTAALVRSARAVPALVELLALGSESMRASAAATLRNLTVIDTEAAPAVVHAGGVRALERVLLRDSTPARATLEALGLLRNLAFDSRCRGPVGEMAIISMLLTMIKRHPPQTSSAHVRGLVELALAALANLLAHNRQNQLNFERARGSSALLHILKTHDLTPIERQHAHGALKNLRDSSQTLTPPPAPSHFRRRSSSSKFSFDDYADGPDGDGVSTVSRRSTDDDDLCSVADDALSDWSTPRTTNDANEETKHARVYVELNSSTF